MLKRRKLPTRAEYILVSIAAASRRALASRTQFTTWRASSTSSVNWSGRGLVATEAMLRRTASGQGCGEGIATTMALKSSMGDVA